MLYCCWVEANSYFLPVFAICAPGAIHGADEVRNKSDLERIPAGHWGDASDLGGAAVFLAAEAANYVQGHILAVDGGWLAR